MADGLVHLVDDDLGVRDALAFLSDHFRWDDATPVGELELVNNGETVEGTLILMSEWKAKLPAHL